MSIERDERETKYECEEGEWIAICCFCFQEWAEYEQRKIEER